MSRDRVWRRYLRFWGPNLEADVDEELRFHLENRIRDYEAHGLTRADAMREARARLGDIERVRVALKTHDTTRARRRTRYEMMERMGRDLRVALRGFRRTPTFTVTAVVILGLGIGMAVAVWAVFNAVLLRRVPVPDASRVVILRLLDRNGTSLALDTRDVAQVRHESRTLHLVAGYMHGGAYRFPLMDGDHPLPLAGAQVDPQFFAVLGVHALMGRLLGPDDGRQSHVMVLSYDAWQRHFGGDPGIIGRRFRQPLLDATYTVVGVAPPGVDFPAGTEYWQPVPYADQAYDVVTRLAPNATPAMARAELLGIIKQFDRDEAEASNVSGADVRSFDEAVVGNARPVLVLMLAAVGLLLLIVCINVGTLLVHRAAGRARELAVRRALGATYGDIVRQLVVESTLLAVAGGSLGLVTGEIARRILIAMAPAQLPRVDAIRVAGVPIGAAAMTVLLAILAFGIGPALLAVPHNPASPLRLDTRSGTMTRSRQRARQALVGSQVALALILLAAAALLTRSVQRLQSIDLGFRSDHVAVIALSIPEKYGDHPYPQWDRIAPRIAAIPGVSALTPTIIDPLIGSSFFNGVWQTDRETPQDVAHGPLIEFDAVGPDYFRVLGVPLVRGRAFEDADRDHSAGVAIVSQSVARRYWPGQDPIGQRIRMADDAWGKDWRTVVGVAGDTRWRALREATPMVYVPYRQSMWHGFIVLRTTLRLETLLPVMRREIHEAEPDVAVWKAQTIDQYLDTPLAQPRMSALLLSAFGLAALLVAAIGLYGIMASAVREQTRDIGVRMALGATPSQVRGEVLRRAMTVAVVGATIGIGCALAASRLVRSLLFEISPTDPAALLGSCAVLLGVALIAAYLPAHRASRIDPIRALRTE